MSEFLQTQNSFAHGEISPDFYATEDTSGLSYLSNMDITISGGLRRRPGLRRLAELPPFDGILIPFALSESENYILFLRASNMRVYENGLMRGSLNVPWTEDDLPDIQYAQRFGTMIFVHPNYRPKILSKSGTNFELKDFNFFVNEKLDQYIPFIKFPDITDVSISLTPNVQSNSHGNFTASQAIWSPADVGTLIHAFGHQWKVTSYESPTVLVAYCNARYTLEPPTKDWYEAAFSTKRGWPRSITFHQNRLVFGGSRDYTSGIWMSKVGLHNNFDAGTGLDDEAIFVTLLSEKRQQISTIVSSNDLQILTTDGEWAISNKPLTPSNVNIRQHTFTGSFAGRYLQPQKCEGSTIFVSKTGRDIRELSLDELGETYNATDLCSLSKHLLNSPIDIAWNDVSNQLFVILSDGKIAVLNKNVNVGILAWARYETDGEFKSIAVLGGKTYVIVFRDGKYYLEVFDENEIMDSGTFNYPIAAHGLPLLKSKHSPKKLRLRKISARVSNTANLMINGKMAPLYNGPFTGDVFVNFLGTDTDCMRPLWTIESGISAPVLILSVSVEGRYLI